MSANSMWIASSSRGSKYFLLLYLKKKPTFFLEPKELSHRLAHNVNEHALLKEQWNIYQSSHQTSNYFDHRPGVTSHSLLSQIPFPFDRMLPNQATQTVWWVDLLDRTRLFPFGTTFPRKNRELNKNPRFIRGHQTLP